MMRFLWMDAGMLTTWTGAYSLPPGSPGMSSLWLDPSVLTVIISSLLDMIA